LWLVILLEDPMKKMGILEHVESELIESKLVKSELVKSKLVKPNSSNYELVERINLSNYELIKWGSGYGVSQPESPTCTFGKGKHALWGLVGSG